MGGRDPTKNNCTKSFWDSFKSVDIYGHSISLTYKGNDTFKTKLGALMSIIVGFMLFAFSLYKFIVLVNSIDPEVSKKVFRRNLADAGVFYPNNYGFDFALSMRGGDLDPKYGYFRVRQVYFYYVIDEETGEKTRIKDKTDLELVKCGTEYLTYPHKDQITSVGVDEFWCTK